MFYHPAWMVEDYFLLLWESPDWQKKANPEVERVIHSIGMACL